LRASSSVSNLVGVEIAKDFGLVESLNVEVAAEEQCLVMEFLLMHMDRILGRLFLI
jgi:hypothetical protein